MTTSIGAAEALRIAMAAKCLPGIELVVLIEILIRAKGHPLGPERLASLSMRELLAAGQVHLKPFSRKQLEQALAYLDGRAPIRIVDEPRPEAHAAKLPASIRVAIASNFSDLADCSFGECRRFLIYELNAERFSLIDERVMSDSIQRISLIADCDVLEARAISVQVRASLVAQGVHAIVCAPYARAESLLGELQAVLRDAPPPWLARRMGIAASPRRHDGAKAEVISLGSHRAFGRAA